MNIFSVKSVPNSQRVCGGGSSIYLCPMPGELGRGGGWIKYLMINHLNSVGGGKGGEGAK